MSKIRALQSFSGLISMGKGQVMECDNDIVLQDLLNAGYIEEVEPAAEAPEETPEETPEEMPEEMPEEKSEEALEEPETETKKAKGADSHETKRTNKK